MQEARAPSSTKRSASAHQIYSRCESTHVPSRNCCYNQGRMEHFIIVKAWIEARIRARTIGNFVVLQRSMHQFSRFARPAFILLSVHALGSSTNTSLFNCVLFAKVEFLWLNVFRVDQARLAVACVLLLKSCGAGLQHQRLVHSG